MSDEADFMLKLIDMVSGPAGEGADSLKKLRKELGGAGKEAESAGTTMQHAFGELIAHGVEFAAEKLVDFGKEAVFSVLEAADHAQRAAIAFDQLAKHGASGAKIFQFARQTAQDLGLDVNDTVHAFEHFLAMQFDPKQAEGLVKMGADLQAIGVSAEQTQSIFHQFAQIKSLGKLQFGSLTNLAQSGVSEGLVIDALVKRLNKTPDQIKKALMNGTISAEDGLNAIGDAIKHKTHENAFGEAGKRVADSTLGGLFGQLKAGAQNSLLDLGAAVAPALTDTFKSLIDSVTGSLSGGTGKSFFDSVVSGVTSLAGIIKSAAPAIGAFVGAFGTAAIDTFSQFASVLKEVFGAFSGGGANSVNIAKMLGETLGTLVAGIAAGAIVIGGAFAAITVAASAVWQGLSASFHGIVDTIGSILAPILNTIANITAIFDSTGLTWSQKLFEIGGQLVQGLVNGLIAVAQAPITTIENIGSNMIAAAKNVFGQHSPSKEFQDIGEQNVAGLALGHQGMNDTVDMSVPSPSSIGAFGGGAGGLGGGAQISVVNHISISGAQDPTAVAKEVERVSLSSLVSAFEQLSVEAA